ncbi:midnolin-like [Haliotis rubra]|uniref:midnolin-like n=1 Tax=Haliotis rubra TaxID=36100 RepID=UPI001EE557BC|nr:midnolin-like [Haliotis rubra]
MAEEEITVNRMANQNSVNARPGQLKLYICPTTGGSVRVIVPTVETVHGLKVAIARKIRIPPERINLLFKNKILKDGTLFDNQVVSESRITLLPNMASGMTFQRPENGVMQALENLTESQVNDFLSGRAPLLLAMRLGDHMMFVQLQLSTSQCVSRRSRGHATPTMSTPPTSPTHPVFPNSAAITRASLAAASRNLSQKLRELTRLTGHAKVGESAQVTVSSRVPTPSNPIATPHPPCSSPGAVIDSMHHLGQGVYSGTFSGTLDPTLQDVEGRPRKDIATIVHILNDLLGASPHLHTCRPFLVQHPTPRRHYHREPTGMSSSLSHGKSEDTALRGKVRQLQMMMEEKRLRRKARREMKAPYQWTNSRSLSEDAPTYCHHAAGNTRDNVPTPSAGHSDTNKMDIPDNMESSTYRNPNLEQETVAV